MNKSWRRNTGGAAPQRSGRYWQEQQKRSSTDDAAWRRRWKLAGLFLAFFGLLGALVVTLLFWPRDLIVLPVVVHYDEPIPVNGLAHEDSQLLKTLLHSNFAVSDPLVASVQGKLFEREKFLQEFDARLGELRPRGPTIWQYTVVVYLSAHGVVDKAGNPCLLLPKSDPHDCSSWLTVKRVIQTIKGRNNLKDTNVVLLLDSNRIRDYWPMGVFDNDFAVRLRETVVASEYPQLFVINSTDAGQQALTAPEMSGSVFGHFVATGLAGNANSDSQRIVTVQELVSYLQTNVSEYTRQFRSVSQYPILIHGGGDSAADCGLAYPISASKIDSAMAGDAAIQNELSKKRKVFLEDRHAQLSQLWNTYQQACSGATFRFQPMLFGQVADRLTRLEDLIIAGTEYDEQYKRVVAQTKDDLERLLTARDKFTNVATTAAVMAQFQVYRDLRDADNRFLPTREFEKWLRERNDPEKKPAGPTFVRSVTALAIWDWLSHRDSISAADIESAETFLELSPTAPSQITDELLPEEVHFVRLLAAYLPWETRDWGKLLARALSLHQQVQQLAAPDDVRAFYWVQEPLAPIETLVRFAQDKLFIGSEDTVADAVKIWDSLIPESGTGRLDGVRSTLDTVVQAYRVRDRSMALSPHFACWAVSKRDPESLKVVDELIRATQKLCQQLDRRASEIDPQSMEETQRALQTLQDNYDGRCKSCLDSAASQEALREIAQLLSFPIPTLDTAYRNNLRNKLMRSRWLVHREFEPDKRELNASQFSLTAADHPAAKMFPPTETPQSLDALGGRVRELMEDLEKASSDLESQTIELLSIEGSDLPDPRTARRYLSEADQQYRWAATFLPSYSEDFVTHLWKYDYQFFTVWQGWRSLRDLWGPEPGTGRDATPYFSLAVARCTHEAGRLYPTAAAHRKQLDLAAAATVTAIAGWKPLEYDEIKIFDDPTADGGFVDHAMQFHSLGDGQEGLATELQLESTAPAIFVEESGRSFPWFNRRVTNSTKTPIGRRSPTRQPTTQNASVLQHAFNSSALADDPNLNVVTLFRGHIKKSPLPIDKGIEAVVFQRPEPTQTSIIVTGKRRAKTQVVFVLDCSGSMGPSEKDGRGDKMTPAKNALGAIVEKIKADADSFDVGFFVFGRKTGKDQHARIEELVKLGPAVENVQEIRRELGEVRPYGFTPLFQAVNAASVVLTNYGQPGKKLLVVITDGENFVEQVAESAARKQAEDAIRTVNATDVQVEIVGFGVGGGPRRGPQITDFAASSSQINYQNSNDIAVVKQRIVDAVGLASYSVSGPGVAPRPQNLGITWKAKAITPGNYTIAIPNGPRETIELFGSEAIAMGYENGRLTHQPYLDNDPEKPVGEGVLRFHTNSYDGTQFGISFQTADHRMMKRPRRAMMSVQPVGNNDVVFYGHETEFETQRPVPVLHYRLAGWPKDATKAQIVMSYTTDETIGSRKVVLNLRDNTLEQPFSKNEGVELRLSTTPSKNDGPVRIMVDELHSSASKQFPLHLALFPQPLTARHSLARRSPDGSRTVTHVFTVGRNELQNAEISLHITTPNERREKWVTADPVSVEVDDWTTRR